MDKLKLYLGDCLEVMKDIPNKSIDLILCDLPYGTTCNKWDNIIPFNRLWSEYERVIKDNGLLYCLVMGCLHLNLPYLILNCGDTISFGINKEVVTFLMLM